MIRLNLSEPLYREIKKLLPDICPDVKFSLKTTDDILATLGFCDVPPCVVAFDLNDSEFEEMLLELIQLEVDAYNTPDGKDPKEDDPYYQRYLKYGWIYDVLFNAYAEI